MTLGQLTKGVIYNNGIFRTSARSDVASSEVDMCTYIVPRTTWIPGILLRTPFLYANPHVGQHAELAATLAYIGGLSIVQKTFSPIEQAQQVKHMKDIPILENCSHDAFGRLLVAADVGIGVDAQERVYRSLSAGVDVFVVNAMFDRIEHVLNTIAMIRRISRFAPIIAGSACTAVHAIALADAGANTVMMYVTEPRMCSLVEAASALQGKSVPIITCGDLTYSGDVTKALAAGASAVFCGAIPDVLHQCIAGLRSSLKFFHCRTLQDLQVTMKYASFLSSKQIA